MNMKLIRTLLPAALLAAVFAPALQAASADE